MRRYDDKHFYLYIYQQIGVGSSSIHLNDQPHEHSKENNQCTEGIRHVVVGVPVRLHQTENSHGDNGKHARYGCLSRGVGQDEYQAPRQQQTSEALQHLEIVCSGTIGLR